MLLNNNIAKTIKCVNGFVPDAVVGFLQERPKGSCYSLDASASSSSPPASSLLVRPLTHSDSLTPSENTPRLTHIHSTAPRFSHNETYSQPVHSYSDSHTGSPTLRLTHSGHSHTEIPAHSAYSCSYSYTQGILRGSRQRYLQSQPDYSHSDSPNFKLTHTQSDSYSKQPILMWQA